MKEQSLCTVIFDLTSGYIIHFKPMTSMLMAQHFLCLKCLKVGVCLKGKTASNSPVKSFLLLNFLLKGWGNGSVGKGRVWQTRRPKSYVPVRKKTSAVTHACDPSTAWGEIGRTHCRVSLAYLIVLKYVEIFYRIKQESFCSDWKHFVSCHSFKTEKPLLTTQCTLWNRVSYRKHEATMIYLH